MPLKPYQRIPIDECGEPLVVIPLEDFAVVLPHPYQACGATYGERSPFYLRQGVLERLYQAQAQLQAVKPGWRLQIFDAYRPVGVQQYMVDWTFDQEVQRRGWARDRLKAEQLEQLWQEVYQFWAVPSDAPATPPPHSTGAAIDLSLVDAEGHAVEMGSPIDEISPRSFPDHFADAGQLREQQFHQHRQLLRQSMEAAGLLQHPREWWHFSWGDQVWVWIQQERRSLTGSLAGGNGEAPVEVARYGRADLVGISGSE